MPTIELSDGTPCEVDPEDYAWALQFRWNRSAATGTKAGYAMRGGGPVGFTEYMHRAIALRAGVVLTPEKPCVDHIDRNHFNNRRSNIRATSYSENNGNVDPRTPTGVLGVYWHKSSGSWGAEVSRHGRRRRRYGFSTVDAAAEWRAGALAELRNAAT